MRTYAHKRGLRRPLGRAVIGGPEAGLTVVLAAGGQSGGIECPHGSRSFAANAICTSPRDSPSPNHKAEGGHVGAVSSANRSETRWRRGRDSNPRIWTQPRSQAARSTKVKPVAFVYTASVRSSVICSGP